MTEPQEQQRTDMIDSMLRTAMFSPERRGDWVPAGKDLTLCISIADTVDMDADELEQF